MSSLDLAQVCRKKELSVSEILLLEKDDELAHMEELLAESMREKSEIEMVFQRSLEAVTTERDEALKLNKSLDDIYVQLRLDVSSTLGPSYSDEMQKHIMEGVSCLQATIDKHLLSQEDGLYEKCQSTLMHLRSCVETRVALQRILGQFQKVQVSASSNGELFWSQNPNQTDDSKLCEHQFLQKRDWAMEFAKLRKENFQLKLQCERSQEQLASLKGNIKDVVMMVQHLTRTKLALPLPAQALRKPKAHGVIWTAPENSKNSVKVSEESSTNKQNEGQVSPANILFSAAASSINSPRAGYLSDTTSDRQTHTRMATTTMISDEIQASMRASNSSPSSSKHPAIQTIPELSPPISWLSEKENRNKDSHEQQASSQQTPNAQNSKPQTDESGLSGPTSPQRRQEPSATQKELEDVPVVRSNNQTCSETASENNDPASDSVALFQVNSESNSLVQAMGFTRSEAGHLKDITGSSNQQSLTNMIERIVKRYEVMHSQQEAALTRLHLGHEERNRTQTLEIKQLRRALGCLKRRNLQLQAKLERCFHMKPAEQDHRVSRVGSASSLKSTDSGLSSLLFPSKDNGGGSTQTQNEWQDVKELGPPPKQGTDVRSPLVQEVLRSWVNSKKKDIFENWVMRVLAGEDVSPRNSRFQPALQISNLSNEVYQGFITLVLPLLLRRKDIKLKISTKEEVRTLHELRILVQPLTHRKYASMHEVQSLQLKNPGIAPALGQSKKMFQLAMKAAHHGLVEEEEIKSDNRTASNKMAPRGLVSTLASFVNR